MGRGEREPEVVEKSDGKLLKKNFTKSWVYKKYKKIPSKIFCVSCINGYPRLLLYIINYHARGHNLAQPLRIAAPAPLLIKVDEGASITTGA